MKPLRLCVSVSLWFAFTAVAQAQAPALGMVLNAEGDIYIQRGAQRTAASRVDFLYGNDKLVINNGRADVLVCPSSERWILVTGSIVDFSGASAKQTSGPAPERKPAKCVLPDIRLDDKSRLRFGALQARGNPTIALLIGGTITTDRPSFDWIPVKDAQSYELAIRDENGNIVWQTQTSATHVDYRASEPLHATRYQWEVKAIANQKTIAQQTANLDIKPNSEYAKPAPSDPAERLLRAAELENAKYYAEAAALYRQLRDAGPGDSRLSYHLVWLYGNAGLMTAATDELTRSGIK